MLNLELRSSTNATTVEVAKITAEKGWRVGKKCLCVCVVGGGGGGGADKKIAISWKLCVLGHPVA